MRELLPARLLELIENMKYTILFLILGGLTCYQAWRGGGWWYLLGWFSLSCFVLATGYAGVGTRVLGKREDGKILAWGKIIHFPYILYSTILWHLIPITES